MQNTEVNEENIKESAVNIQWQWTEQIGMNIEDTNLHLYHCMSGDYNSLINYNSRLFTLWMLIRMKLCRNQEIEIKFNDIEKKINSFFLNLNNKERIVNFENSRIYLKQIIEIHKILMDEIEHHKILHMIKRNPKDKL